LELRVRRRRVNLDVTRIFRDRIRLESQDPSPLAMDSPGTNEVSFVIASSDTLAGDGGIANLAVAVPL
jgi:hypothetical protein